MEVYRQNIGDNTDGAVFEVPKDMVWARLLVHQQEHLSIYGLVTCRDARFATKAATLEAPDGLPYWNGYRWQSVPP
jgi:hypothetical protein